MATTQVTGIVRRASLEGGLWVLVTDDGTTYQLGSAPEDMCRDGLRVEVSGHVDENAVTIGMMGDVLRVASFRVQ